ncbi:MAG: transglycosylase domain-containing protein [Clostridiales bacterium]|jgi:penicillin-binding protein 1A|nr:transglycosylase domain-containing protein [Clostridiales bacterium]
MNYSQDNNIKRMKRYRAAGRKIQNKAIYTVLRIMVASVLIFAFAAGAAGVGFYMSVIAGAPDVREFQRGIVGGSLDSVVLDVHGNEIVRLDAGVSRTFAEWEEIPQYLIDAFIASEDERFFEHSGVDAHSMLRAVYQTFFHDNTQGASTITQQLVKNYRNVRRNTMETKLQEQYMAVRFEAMLVEELGSVEAAKQQILHEYLNIIYLGGGNIGVQAAARFYFGKDVNELTLSESVVIAAITRWPWQNNPIRFPEYNQGRKERILDSMLRLEMITGEQHYYALNDDVYERIMGIQDQIEPDAHIWSYFVDAVIERLRDDFMAMGMTAESAYNRIFHDGLRIYTTLEPDIQGILDAAFLNEDLFPTNWQDFEFFMELDVTVRNETTGRVRHAHRTSTHHGVRTASRDDFDTFVQWALADVLAMDEVVVGNYVLRYQPQPQSSMVILDHNNGHVVAIAGQRGEKQTNRGFCRATYARRQPGSVFKIFASYAPALDLGLITAATGIDDVPNYFFDYSLGRNVVWPRNWWAHNQTPYRGWTRVRHAVEQSYNVVAVHNWHTVGGQRAFNYLQNFGFTTLNPNEAVNASAVLGGLTHGVTNLEITAAMGAIVNAGILHQPIFYTKVLDRNGEIIIDNRGLSPSQVMGRDAAYMMTDIMRGVMTRGTATHAAIRNVPMDFAGKTGTTQNGRDVYFVASTPYFSAGVWVGHDRIRDMTGNVTGGNRPDTRIWRYVMEQVHEHLEERRFERPPGFSTQQVCGVSGRLASSACHSDPRGSQVRTELFAPGTIPITHCHVHVYAYVEIPTGLLPSSWTPVDQIERRSFITRNRDWMEIAGEVGITDAWLEEPTVVSTLFNPFVDSDYDYQGAPDIPDEVHEDIVYPGIDFNGDSYNYQPIYTPQPPPTTTQPPTEAPTEAETAPEPSLPFVVNPIDRPPIVWPEDLP